MTNEEALKAQEKAVRSVPMPHFAPYNGVCPSCGRWIYGEGGANPESPVTGCPYCRRSYCE